MKVFISADMEGIACATHGDHVKMEGPAYVAAQKWMTGEVNAAIEGAIEAGADEFVVADGHGLMRNLLPDELHEDALLVLGTPRPLLQMEGIDESCDLAFFIGYHARAGSAFGVMAHTHVGKIVYELYINGKPVTEAAFNGAVAGHFGVPVALVAGDDALLDEVAMTHPWAERVITKWAIGPTAARNLTPAASRKVIRAAAQRAVERVGEMKIVKLEAPIEFRAHFLKALQAQLVSDIPGVERFDSRSVRYVGADMVEITKIWRLMINAGLSGFAV
ncbi:M55 family metallopeptidase [Candidatus Bipolaricaulota bacterium]|nr:M55 family metallopeptidase [Candidatus Bipolaricaulota bacterium]